MRSLGIATPSWVGYSRVDTSTATHSEGNRMKALASGIAPLLLIIAVGAAEPAQADLLARLEPANPTSGTELIVHVVNTEAPQCFPRGPIVTRTGNDLRVRLSVTDSCRPSDFTTQRDYPIGSFAAGIYSLGVEFCIVNPPPFPTDCGVILQTPFAVEGEVPAVSVPMDSGPLLTLMLVLLATVGARAMAARRKLD
jgi:hypothetical protein